MSEETNVEETPNTAGDAGSSTKNGDASANKETPPTGGIKLDDVAALMDKLLTEKLTKLKPAEQEQPTPSTAEDKRLYTEDEMQKRINSAVRSRLTEKDEQFSKKLEEAKTQWLQELSVEFEKQKADAVQVALAERDFAQQKKVLQEELKLTDAQVARLQGKTIDELRADALLLGFAKEPEKEEEKKAAPKVNPGTSDAFITGLDKGSDLSSLVREGLRQ